MNVAITLNASGSTDAGGWLIQYYWSFGDGGTAAVTTATVSHTYTATGIYTATLWVLDNSGTWSTASDSARITIGTATGSTTTTLTPTTTSPTTSSTVPNQLPVANAGPNQATQTLTSLTFNGSANDPDGSIASASWSFGDGTTGGGLVTTHAYAAAGTYTATLTVTDNRGGTDTDTATITVTNRPPIANAGPDTGAPPNNPVGLNGSGSSDPDGTIVGWHWNFGDGTTGNGAMPSHTYAAPGTYTATLSVTDNNGATASDSANVNVSVTGGWARAIGSTASDSAYATGVDTAGNVFVAGAFRGTVNFGGTSKTSAGNSDWFLAKYSSSNTLLWVRSMGGTADDFVDALAVDDTGDVVVGGRFGGTATFGGTALVASGSSDMAIAKYAGTDGAHRWSKRFGGPYDDAASAIAVDGSENVYFTGYFRGTVNFGGATLQVPFDTDLDVYVAKLDRNGTHLWSKNFTNTGNERGYGIAADASGNVVVAGYFSNTITFGGTTLASANAMTDIFVARFTSTGAHSWSKRFGASDGSESAYAVALDSSSNVVVAGYATKALDLGGGSLASLGGSDAFVAKYAASNGNHMWSRRLGGAGNEYAYGVAVHPTTDDVYLGGSFASATNFGGTTLTPTGGVDAFVAKYGATGTLAWAKRLGGADSDIARAIDAHTGGVAVTGYFFANGNFDGTTITSAGGADAFLSRLVP